MKKEMDILRFNQLLNRFSSDESAFVELYTYYFPRLVLSLTFKFGDRGFAEDIVQKFFSDKIFRIKKQGYIDHPTSWLFTICYRLALTEKRNRSVTVVFSDELVSDAASDVVATTDEDILRSRIDLPDKEYFSTLYEAGLSEEIIEKLKTLDRQSTEIILLHYFEGFSLKEIAGILGLNYNTTLSKMHRAMKFLRRSCNALLLLIGLI